MQLEGVTRTERRQMDKGKVAGTSGLPSVENLSGTNTPRRGILGGRGGSPLSHRSPFSLTGSLRPPTRPPAKPECPISPPAQPLPNFCLANGTRPQWGAPGASLPWMQATKRGRATKEIRMRRKPNKTFGPLFTDVTHQRSEPMSVTHTLP